MAELAASTVIVAVSAEILVRNPTAASRSRTRSNIHRCFNADVLTCSQMCTHASFGALTGKRERGGVEAKRRREGLSVRRVLQKALRLLCRSRCREADPHALVPL